MKKTYIKPQTELFQAQTFEMLALSLLGPAEQDSEVLVKEDEWNIWADEEE